MITLKVDPQNPEPEHIRAAADVIRRGKLVIFPTETVYGVAADALNEGAVKRVFDAKGRSDKQPLPVQIAGLDEIAQVAEYVPEKARDLAMRFWPGPLTLVLDKHHDIPNIVSGGRQTIGVRVPSHPVALALLRELGTPIVATSANISGDEPPKTALEAIEELGNDVELVLDAGESDLGVASTVVDVSADPPRLLRRGTIPPDEIRGYVGELEEVAE